MVLFHGQSGLGPSLLLPLVLVVLCDAKPFLKRKACGVPDLPAHSIFHCQPALCQGSLDPGLFKAGTILELSCLPGYTLASQPALAICQGGEWHSVRDVVCKPQGTSAAPPRSSRLPAAFIPILAAAALSLLAFLVMVLSCALLRPRSSVCHCRCHSGSYEVFEDSDTLEHVGEPDADRPGSSMDPLPTYEEAVYGRVGAPWLPLVLSEGVWTHPVPPEPCRGAGEPPDSPPPSYQEAVASAAESLAGGRPGTA
ncbi:hypothetical protein lerEdw1_009784 [Lerista edwardsae]|nr:hypothetical protein lerEdw1_009784 [Lerista edwardsae]